MRPLTRSTPDALWSARSLRMLRPAAVAWTDVHRGTLLRGCSLSVPPGARLLIVSEPEAAGSALIRVLAGLARLRRGSIRIAGLPAGQWSARMAHVGPGSSVPEWMTPREVLDLSARLLELPPAEAIARVERTASWARISPAQIDRPIRRGGPPLIERTAYASALVGNPEVLLLDEPLRALDAAERIRLLRLPGPRRTVILASRYPASEAGFASHVALLCDGRVDLVAPISGLEEEGLPLSHRGIAELADRRAAAPRRREAAPVTAAR